MEFLVDQHGLNTSPDWDSTRSSEYVYSSFFRICLQLLTLFCNAMALPPATIRPFKESDDKLAHFMVAKASLVNRLSVLL